VQNQTSPLILTFGAADPIGAIGVQADVASFAAMGCYGLSVTTSILISDTAKVEDVQEIDADWVADQARVILEDMPVAAFKVGAINNIETISVIAEIVSDYPEIPLILDPFASSMPDLDQDCDDMLIAIREILIPQSTLLMLSSVELRHLAETWRDPSTENLIELDVMHLIELGCANVLVTGIPSDLHDITNTLFGESGVIRQDNWQRIPGSFVGAGNTLSAAIAAIIATGHDVPEAVLEAQEFTAAALVKAQRLGMGKLIPDRYFWVREFDKEQ
jgi:hydroxymethylpyrimidine/phosphomethylpyrimidine kinase